MIELIDYISKNPSYVFVLLVSIILVIVVFIRFLKDLRDDEDDEDDEDGGWGSFDPDLDLPPGVGLPIDKPSKEPELVD
ncbi:MAG: hypothetical protein AAF620_10585 [Bacteroidota bacterium]